MTGIRLITSFILLTGLNAYSLQSYQCWNVAYSVTTYDSNGHIIDYYEDSYEECGWVETGSGSNNGGGSSGGGSNTGSNPCRVSNPYSRLAFADHLRQQKASRAETRVVIDMDIDGDDYITPNERIDLDELGVDRDYFFRTLFAKHHKAIRIGNGPYLGGLLVMDLNGNGTFDHRKELLTNQFTVEKLPTPNAAVALMQYDRLERGGNEDGLITKEDVFWEDLLIWRDANTNGLSEPEEMRRLEDLNIISINPNPRPFQQGQKQGYKVWFYMNGGLAARGELF